MERTGGGGWLRREEGASMSTRDTAEGGSGVEKSLCFCVPSAAAMCECSVSAVCACLSSA